MASIAYNIGQITHFDIQNLSSDKEGYAKYDFPKVIEKLGYCCEPKGIGSWIYLYLKKEEEQIIQIPIQIGKSGMFEIQPETYLKLNEEGINEQIDMKIKIVAIEIPKDIEFTLDFAYNIT